MPRNIYGATKVAAEHLCELNAFENGLPCIVLRTSRFFPEPDDRKETRNAYEAMNVKVNEFLYRRVDIEDAVLAVDKAIERARSIGFGRYVISAKTPFGPQDVGRLTVDAPGVVQGLFPDFADIYGDLGWRMFPTIGRVYDNNRARSDLGWAPRYDFRRALDCLKDGHDPRSDLALQIGIRGYRSPELPATRPSDR